MSRPVDENARSTEDTIVMVVLGSIILLVLIAGIVSVVLEMIA